MEIYSTRLEKNLCVNKCKQVRVNIFFIKNINLVISYFVHKVRNWLRSHRLKPVLRSRSRWSRNYLRPGAGAKNKFK